MNLREICALYKIDPKTLWNYRESVRTEFDAAYNTYIFKGKIKKRKGLSKTQIKMIVAIMQDPPEGYKCVRGVLIKLKDNE